MSELRAAPFTQGDSIAIIGAGPAGIHMAFELTKRGYKNIVVFERERQVGGQSRTVIFEDTSFDLGTLNFMNHYPVLAALQEELELELVNIDAIPMALFEGSQISGIRFIFEQYRKQHPKPGPKWWQYLCFLFKLKRDFKTATKLNDDLVDQYGFPKRDKAVELSKTAAEYLRDNNLDTLIYVKEFTCRAWGSVGPDRLTTFQDFIGIKGSTSGPNRPIVKGGYQSVWETMASRANLKVHFETEIISLESLDGRVTIGWRAKKGEAIVQHTRDFSFVISSAPFPLKYLVNPTPAQHAVFTKFNTHNQNPCIVTLYATDKKEEETIWLVNYEDSRQPYTTVCVGNEHVLQNPHGYRAGKKVIKTALQCSFRETQFGDVSGEDFAAAKVSLKTELECVFKETNVEILHQHVWGEYLISMKSEHIAQELPWKLLDLQSENKMWFIGVGACGPAIPNILAYNNMLLSLHGMT